MSIKIITVGKLKEKYLKSAVSEYEKRLTPYTNLKIIEIPDEQAPENLSEKDLEIIKNKEGEKILSKIKKEDYVINLEINGKLLSSEDLAGLIE
ncbi:MAG: 23S rRNA (pseudouridine(1915)-N(3))-methyltransferase RlmH, partial [Gallicola sp.]|nr:23S rRNA (pseudouridine(1915)-N(3))-methyltransferase RlmH [Gallicola sp.]